jgi:hypothetical protein
VKIYRYRLEIEDVQVIDVPRRFKALSADVQNGQLTVWMLVDETEEVVPVRFFIVGTGNPADHVFKFDNGTLKPLMQFAGTVQMPPFVWHVFVEGVFGGTVEDVS